MPGKPVEDVGERWTALISVILYLQVFEPERVNSSKGVYHVTCFKCQRCHHLLDSATSSEVEGEVLCQGCAVRGRQAGEGGKVWLHSHVDTTSIVAGPEEEGCPGCGGRVYQAERRVAGSASYHIRCFSCKECRRLLDQGSFWEGPDKELLCKCCHLRLHQVSMTKAAEADKALDLSLIKPKDEEHGCPRCGGAVFPQEATKAGKSSYHRTCLACCHCDRRLEVSAILVGEDDQVYCQTCHIQQCSAVLRSYSSPSTASIQATPGAGDACLACGGKVYEPEKISSKTGLYHKQCFSCQLCKKKLDSTLVHAFEAPDTNIYCGKCFVESFGEGSSPLVWSDTTTILPRDGLGCPRCGGAVFKQEEIVEKGRNFHKRCFTCKKCSRPQADKLQVFVGFDEEIYCRGCYPGVGRSSAGGQDTAVIQAARDGCPRCGGKVFDAERFVSKGRQFHKTCFNCFSCHTALSLSSMFATPESDIACNICYQQHFFTGGKNAYLDYSVVGESKGFGPVCPACKGDVYEAEKIVTRSQSYHRKCLACSSCRRALDASSYYEGSDSLVYCKGCYTAQFGDLAPAPAEEMIHFPATGPEDTKCGGCGGKVFEAEKMVSSFGTFHRQCFKCVECSVLLHTSPVFRSKGGGLYCKLCLGHAKERARVAGEDWEGALVSARAMVQTDTIKAEEGDPDRCPRCSGKVFPAERMAMGSGSYHRSCFCCGHCRRMMDFHLACDTPSGDICCRNCYAQRYGPASLPMDGSTVVDTAVIKPTKEQAGCPRCGGAVFKVEEVVSKGRSYHKRCASCSSCSRTLDTRSICSGEGEDKEIYCSSCYRSKYRKSRPSTPVAPNLLPAEDGEDACARCKGRIFEPERLRSKTSLYHKSCFSCRQCGRSLESTLAQVASGPDNEIYCKRCHGEKFPSEGGPAWADPALLVATDGQGCPR